MTDRRGLSQDFLDAAGWGTAARGALAGDASMRSYDRLRQNGHTAVLMDAPPEKGEDVRPFVTIARHLRAIGLSAPVILAEDSSRGFLLLEDLGDDLYVRVALRGREVEEDIYRAATDALAQLQAAPPPPGLPAYDTAAMAAAAGLAVQWYARAITGVAADPASLVNAVADTLARDAARARVLVLRDYHSENLLWLPDRVGAARVGLLDFQNAEYGQAEYDLVSMLQDARRDVSPGIEAQMIRHFAEVTGRAETDVARATAALGAQRALRILGVFARLSLLHGKPGYVRFIPRVWGQLQQNLATAELTPLAAVVERALPTPTDAALQRIMDQCGSIRPT